MRPVSRRNGFKIKIVLVGDLAVGKTSIFMRIKDDSFGARPTVGVEFCQKEIIVDDVNVTVSVLNLDFIIFKKHIVLL